MNLYCITAQCLTPIGNHSNINKQTGMYQSWQMGESLADAIIAAMDEIAGAYKEASETAILNYDHLTVTIMDNAAHIVNFYWGFLGHKA